MNNRGTKRWKANDCHPGGNAGGMETLTNRGYELNILL